MKRSLSFGFYSFNNHIESHYSYSLSLHLHFTFKLFAEKIKSFAHYAKGPALEIFFNKNWCLLVHSKFQRINSTFAV